MADTETLRPYRRDTPPSIPGGEAQYLDEQLKRIEALLSVIVAVLKKHDARLEAGSL